MKRKQAARILRVRDRLEDLAKAKLASARHAELTAQEEYATARDELLAQIPGQSIESADLERRFEQLRALEQNLQTFSDARVQAEQRLQSAHVDTERTRTIHERLTAQLRQRLDALDQKANDDFGGRNPSEKLK